MQLLCSLKLQIYLWIVLNLHTFLTNLLIYILIISEYFFPLLITFLLLFQEATLFNTFLEWVNQLHPTIKFEGKSDSDSITFLDTVVLIEL